MEQNQIAKYPRNDWTEMIERTSAQNRSGVRSAPASAEPLPTTRSAALGTEVPGSPPSDVLPPLTPEEKAELDRRALAAGVSPEALGLSPSDINDSPYESLEDAIAAGAPVERPVSVAPMADHVLASFGMLDPPRQTAREFMMAARTRLPDFRRVQGIDLVRGLVYVDGMEFPIPPTDVQEFKKYVIEIARLMIDMQLKDAIMGLNLAASSAAEGKGGPAEVPGVRIDGHQSGESQEAGPPVSGMQLETGNNVEAQEPEEGGSVET